MNGKVIFYTFITLFVSGCAIEKISTVNEPISLPLPVKSKTILTGELVCFGDMLADYRYVAGYLDGNAKVKPLVVSLQSVKDATGISSESSREIPPDMTDMATGVVLNVGGPLRVAHIPGSQERLDAINAFQINQQIRSMSPYFRFKQYWKGGMVLYGALTEYDRTFGNDKDSLDMKADFGGGRGETNFSASHEDIVNRSRMTMDFRAIDTSMGDAVNSVSSTNTVWLYQYGRDNSFGLSVNGNSIGYAKSITEVDARHAAIRLLIELGLIQTISKYERIPYWKCLPGASKEGYTRFIDVLKGQKQEPNDLRDADVIMDVKRDFEYGDYINPTGYVLEYKRRDSQKSEIEFSSLPENHPLKKQTIAGKIDKLVAVLALHQKNNLSLPHDPFLALKTLYEKFQQEGVIPVNDTGGYSGTNMYLALWLNVPVKPNARWIP